MDLFSLGDAIAMTATAKLPSVPRELLFPPGGLNLNVILCTLAVLLLALSTCGYWLWDWRSWCCFWLNVLAIHFAGSVIHDACHLAAHRNRLLNAALGHVSALILGFAFPVFTRVHLQHHAHVNDPVNDPDHFVSTGGPLWLIAPRFFYHEVFFFRRRLWQKYELLEWFLSRLVLVGIVAASLHYGFFPFVVNYWFSPALVVGIALGFFFDYFPHRPFVERDRWKNARVYASPILNLLILGQNYHLVHHLWPSIPWYRYQAAYRATQPLLEAKGSPLRLGILADGRSLRGFLYDLLIGIRWHRQETETAPRNKVIS